MTDLNTQPPAQIQLNYESPPPLAITPVRGRWIMPLLTLGVTAAALAMYWRGLASWLEAISFVTGAICVWLTVRENIWNFPIGLLNNITFAIVFFQARLLNDASLQIVYFVLGLIGWYWWLYGGERRTALRVSRTPLLEGAIVLLSGVVLTLILSPLAKMLGGALPFWDAITTALSLCAQWLLNRKRLENWYFWIAADLIYIPLYAYKNLYLTSILYSTFLIMCLIGVWQWRATLKAQRAAGAA